MTAPVAVARDPWHPDPRFKKNNAASAAAALQAQHALQIGTINSAIAGAKLPAAKAQAAGDFLAALAEVVAGSAHVAYLIAGAAEGIRLRRARTEADT